MGQSITVGGVDLGGVNYGLTITRDNYNIPLAPRDVDIQPKGAEDGAASQGDTAREMQIRLSGFVEGTTPTDLLQKCDRIRKVLAGGLQLYVLDYENASITDADYQRGYYARPIGPVNFPRISPTGCRVQFTLVVPAGRAQGLTSETQNELAINLSSTFNVPSSGTQAGNTPSRNLVATFTNNAGTVTSIVLANTTRSESATWSGTLAAGDMLRFDTERQIVEKSTDSGTTWTNANSGLTAAHTFAQVTDGTADSFTVTTDGTDVDLALTWEREFI